MCHMQCRIHIIYSKYALIALTSLHACANGIDAYSQPQNTYANSTSACFRRVHETWLSR